MALRVVRFVFEVAKINIRVIHTNNFQKVTPLKILKRFNYIFTSYFTDLEEEYRRLQGAAITNLDFV